MIIVIRITGKLTFQNSEVLYDVEKIQELEDTIAKQEQTIEVLQSFHYLGESYFAKCPYSIVSLEKHFLFRSIQLRGIR